MWILQKILQWWLRFIVRIVFIKPFVCLRNDLSHNGKGFPNHTKIVLSFSIFCGTINLKRYFYLKEDTLCTRKIHSLFQLTSQLTNDSICYITVMLLSKKRIGTKPTWSIFLLNHRFICLLWQSNCIQTLVFFQHNLRIKKDGLVVSKMWTVS